MRRIYRIFCLLTICSAGCSSAVSQALATESIPAKCLTAMSRKPETTRSRVFSAGVLNARATALVRPAYPRVASAVNVNGSVEISVLIDEMGCVALARAVSGHPFLIPASLKAAKASSFEPVLLEGQPARVSGVIVYRYQPDRMNWLELGFRADSYDALLAYLPGHFDRENVLLTESKDRTFYEKQRVLEEVLESIQINLVSNPKSALLFGIGREIKLLMDTPWRVTEQNGELRQLQVLLELRTDVSPGLKVSLRELVNESEPQEVWRRLRSLQDRLFALGN